MRVLVVHNRYSSRVPSGENLAVDDELRWLREVGADIHVYQVSNDDAVGAGGLQRIRQAAESVWSISVQREFAKAIDRVNPDIVHIHNLFPLLTGSAAWTAERRGIPVVWTVHNRRVLCVAGTNFRDDAPCHQCRPGWRVPGIRHACYADSRTASGLVTAATSLFRRNARRRVTAVAISDHMRRWLVDEAGFAAERVRLKYNGVADSPVGTPLEPAEASRAFVFAGHLTDHKGVTLLLDAWGRIGDVPASLVVLGDGPRAADVQAAAAADPRISWLGAVAADEIPTHLATARAAIVPSVWEEPFGRSAAEALACGRPVVTTGTGGLAEVVDEASGWITGTDPAHLAAAIVEAATANAEVARRSRAARQRHADRFSPEATTKALLGVYDEVIH